MPVFLHYQQDRLNSVLKGRVSNRWLFLNAHIYTCRTVSNAYNWQMLIWREVNQHIFDQRMYCIYLLSTCKYLTDAHVQYSEKCQIHLLEECLHANMQKSVKCIYLTNANRNISNAYIWQMQIETYQMHIFGEHSNAYAEVSIHIYRSYAYWIFANMHKMYYNKCSHRICRTVSNAYIWWKHICKYTEKKCQMYRTDNCLHEVSNAYDKYLYANMQKCQNDKHWCKYTEKCQFLFIFAHYTL